MNHATAKTIGVDEIPVIDMTGLGSSDPAAQRAVAVQMREAAERIGFFYVRNHGVPQDLVDRVFATSKAFKYRQRAG